MEDQAGARGIEIWRRRVGAEKYLVPATAIIVIDEPDEPLQSYPPIFGMIDLEGHAPRAFGVLPRPGIRMAPAASDRVDTLEAIQYSDQRADIQIEVDDVVRTH